MKRNNETEAAIHLSLQGKGGVGKSLVASILAQYFIHRGTTIRCIDTDPVNQTFAQYKRLPVERVKLIRDGGIDQRGFDALMELCSRRKASSLSIMGHRRLCRCGITSSRTTRSNCFAIPAGVYTSIAS